MRIMRVILVFIVFASVLCLVSAQEYSMDINIDRQTYSSGENVSYKIILLQDGQPFSALVPITISDAQSSVNYSAVVSSNSQQEFKLQPNFISGYWQISASFEGKSVKRFFSIGEREGAEFSINGDTLTITNVGNVPYTKTVQILIGDKVTTQKQNIPVNESKELKLLAPNGVYNVQVTDGIKTIESKAVQLTGTGNVIGALDKDLVKNQPVLGGVREDGQNSSFLSSPNLVLPYVFIGAVFGLAVLFYVEKMMRRRRGAMAQRSLNA